MAGRRFNSLQFRNPVSFPGTIYRTPITETIVPSVSISSIIYGTQYSEQMFLISYLCASINLLHTV